MKNSKDKLKVMVLTDHMPWGHRAIAKAIYGYLKQHAAENDLDVRYVEVKAEMGVLNDLYVFLYRYLPYSNRWSYRLMKNKQLRDLFEETSKVNLPGLKHAVNKVNPDLIICCYYFHGLSLGKWKVQEGKKFKLWAVMSDPWTINTATIVKNADLSLTYDEVGVALGKSLGIPESKLLATGWWVRPEMYRDYDRNAARRKLGFKDDRPVVFVGGGSLGNNALTRLLPVLMTVKTKVGFVFNTGVDRVGYKLVEQFIKILRRMGRSDLVEIKNFGWIENMGEVLAASDIVFGKAGPNFLFDVVAAKKPFVAITHVGGQEDGNIDLIRKKKLGWVKEKNGYLADFLEDYLKDPKAYEKKFAKSIEAEAAYNQKSLPMILERIKDLNRG